VHVDQFTRWLCEKCGSPSICSWHKTYWESGAGDVERMTFGQECWDCGWPLVVCYPAPDMAPRAIYGPFASTTVDQYAYEQDALRLLEASISNGEPCRPSAERDRDWSDGCAGPIAS
jgi:hypothetical protein